MELAYYISCVILILHGFTSPMVLFLWGMLGVFVFVFNSDRGDAT